LKQEARLLKKNYFFISESNAFNFNAISVFIISVVYSLGTVLSASTDLDLSSLGLPGRLSIGHQFFSIYGG